MSVSRYEFTKKLETGNAIIDKEHRELFQAVNKLLEACSEGKGRASMDETINFLNNYVNQHFSHEEQLQKQSGYARGCRASRTGGVTALARRTPQRMSWRSGGRCSRPTGRSWGLPKSRRPTGR